jgi:archaellum component FlaC
METVSHSQILERIVKVEVRLDGVEDQIKEAKAPLESLVTRVHSVETQQAYQARLLEGILAESKETRSEIKGISDRVWKATVILAMLMGGSGLAGTMVAGGMQSMSTPTLPAAPTLP